MKYVKNFRLILMIFALQYLFSSIAFSQLDKNDHQEKSLGKIALTSLIAGVMTLQSPFLGSHNFLIDNYHYQSYDNIHKSEMICRNPFFVNNQKPSLLSLIYLWIN
jgi:hypothetical protein